MDDDEFQKQLKFMRELCEHLSEEALANEISSSLFSWSSLSLIREFKCDRGLMNKKMKEVFDIFEKSESIKENSGKGNSNRC